MLDNTSILEMIKQAAVEAVDAMQPCRIVFGKIISLSPLKISVDQKLILTSAQLAFTRTGKTFIDNELVPGGKVAMIRQQGGQMYLVLDKVV